MSLELFFYLYKYIRQEIFCILLDVFYFQIKLSFLMVGHTHEDVDQMFSRISIQLGNKAIKTLDQLHEELKRAYHPVPSTVHIDNMWDYRALALQSPIQLAGHKNPHSFTFRLVEDSVKMGYKEWPMERVANKTVDITELASAFNVDPMPLSTIPEKGRKLFEAMRVDIPKWEKSGTLGEDEKERWIRHLQTMEIFNEPVVAQAKDLPQFRRICPVQEIQLAVGEDLRRHMLSLTQESTVRKIFLVYLLDIILNNISINQFLLH